MNRPALVSVRFPSPKQSTSLEWRSIPMKHHASPRIHTAASKRFFVAFLRNVGTLPPTLMQQGDNGTRKTTGCCSPASLAFFTASRISAAYATRVVHRGRLAPKLQGELFWGVLQNRKPLAPYRGLCSTRRIEWAARMQAASPVLPLDMGRANPLHV